MRKLKLYEGKGKGIAQDRGCCECVLDVDVLHYAGVA